jgi:hypothetical protein
MARNTARERLEAALARIDDPKGEGARACLTVYREQAKAAADAADARAKYGISLGPVDRGSSPRKESRPPPMHPSFAGCAPAVRLSLPKRT